MQDYVLIDTYGRWKKRVYNKTFALAYLEFCLYRSKMGKGSYIPKGWKIFSFTIWEDDGAMNPEFIIGEQVWPRPAPTPKEVEDGKTFLAMIKRLFGFK